MGLGKAIRSPFGQQLTAPLGCLQHLPVLPIQNQDSPQIKSTPARITAFYLQHAHDQGPAKSYVARHPPQVIELFMRTNRALKQGPRSAACGCPSSTQSETSEGVLANCPSARCGGPIATPAGSLSAVQVAVTDSHLTGSLGRHEPSGVTIPAVTAEVAFSLTHLARCRIDGKPSSASERSFPVSF